MTCDKVHQTESQFPLADVIRSCFQSHRALLLVVLLSIKQIWIGFILSSVNNLLKSRCSTFMSHIPAWYKNVRGIHNLHSDLEDRCDLQSVAGR